jgi:hypothetical protein
MRLKILIFYLFTFLILLIGLIFFALSINRPYTGIVLSVNHQGIWTVESVDPNGAAYQAGMQARDIPIEVNNQPAQTFLNKYSSAGAVYGQLIQELTVIDQNGQLKSFILAESLPTFNAVTELTMWLVTCIIFWIVGFYVYFKRPQNSAAKLLCLCGLFFGLTLGANMAGERAVPMATQVSVCALGISPFLLLHFFIILPEERTSLRKNPLLYLIYLPAVITVILFFFLGYANGQPLPWFRGVRLAELVIALLAVAGVAIFNFVHAASPRTRQQMKIMLVSSVAALIPFLILSVIFSNYLETEQRYLWVPDVIFKFYTARYGIRRGHAKIAGYRCCYPAGRDLRHHYDSYGNNFVRRYFLGNCFPDINRGT